MRRKRWLKGVYDSRPNNQTYLVTGSARLDVISPMERFGGLLAPGKGKPIGNNR